jgi:D-3-phosphoglycerate dehydrogenase / 2-oxoglutarate reductase
MERIVVTPRSLSQGGNPLLERITRAGYQLVFPSPGRQPSEAELAAALPGAVGYLAGVERVSAALLAGAGRLRVISRNGTGVDNVDLEAAHRAGITVCRAEGANARGVAELAFGHLLAAARAIPRADAALKAGRWAREKGLELEGRTLGVVGCGRIGRLVARFALAFDMRVLGFDLHFDRSLSPAGLREAPLEQLLREADLLTLHCPPPASGGPLLDRAAVAALRPGAIVVNTARQGLVDEAAMAAALRDGRVRAYTVDAFDAEPPTDWSLISSPQVVATPHVGGFTDESVDRATAAAVDNLLAALGAPREGPPG